MESVVLCLFFLCSRDSKPNRSNRLSEDDFDVTLDARSQFMPPVYSDSSPVASRDFRSFVPILLFRCQLMLLTSLMHFLGDSIGAESMLSRNDKKLRSLERLDEALGGSGDKRNLDEILEAFLTKQKV